MKSRVLWLIYERAVHRERLFRRKHRDQQKRANLEFEVRRTKEGVERYKSQIEPLKEQEQQLSADLNAEKAKLQELESRLDLLERAIEADRQKLEDKPAPTKNP